MLNWGCGDYITSVQWVQDGSKVNQSPGITAPWSDSTQNNSVNSYSPAPGHISHRSEERRTEMWPLRAAGLVNGLWRCDERLLWHLFALGQLPWAVLMQVWGLVPLVLSCWLDRLWSLPSSCLVVFAFQRSLAKVDSITLCPDGYSPRAPTAVAPRSPEL
jgi:hypothetical protein